MESVYDLYQRGCELLDHGDYQAAMGDDTIGSRRWTENVGHWILRLRADH